MGLQTMSSEREEVGDREEGFSEQGQLARRDVQCLTVLYSER